MEGLRAVRIRWRERELHFSDWTSREGVMWRLWSKFSLSFPLRSREEHGGEIPSIKEEGNREHAAGTPSIMQNNTEEYEVDLSQSTSDKDSIFRIPGLFKMRNGQAYTPYKFSIGPWHFGETQLLRTGQKLKESILEGLIHRYPDPAAKKRQLEEAIKNVHGKARECYEGGDVYDGGKNMDVAKEEFEKILLLDGCFIIELFRKNAGGLLRQEIDFQLFSGGMIQVIIHDLLLLENQIPWFVLELLFDETSECLQDMNSTLVALAIKFFKPVISCYEPQGLQSLESMNDPNIIHLVDFVLHFWIFPSITKRSVFEYRELDCGTLIPSATRLKEVGVKLQKTESTKISDATFENGVLKIPRLRITPWTETLFRSVVIFEQYNFSFPWVTSYVILLDCLVNTLDDVDLMSRAGILDNKLNPEETANFLNRVRDNTLITEFYYAPLCEDVNRYCKRRWPRWRASLIHNYFTKPWAIVSVFFAASVLFFTIMQVFY